MHVRMTASRLSLLAAASLVLGGCTTSRTSAPTRPPATWHVGAFTVRQLAVPASVINGPDKIQVGNDTVLRVSTTAPYMVTRRTLGSIRWTTVTRLDCAQQPVWTEIQGPQAALLCAGPVGGPASENRLILITSGGSVSAYTLPVQFPVAVMPRIVVNGVEFGGASGDLLWTAYYSTEPPISYGSGLIALASGKDTVVPASLSAPSFSPCVSPDDSLYWIERDTVYRWQSGLHTWSSLGPLPSFVGYHSFNGGNGCVGTAVANDGSVWTAASATEYPGLAYDYTSWYFERGVAGSHRVQSWKIHGDLISVGAGYAVYFPASDPTSVDIYFPLQRRTLHFRNLDPPVSLHLNGFAQIGQRYFNPAMQVVLTGKQARPLEIEISQ